MHYLVNNLEGKTFIDLLQARAAAIPNQVAYTFLLDGETQAVSLTYQELDCHARAIAAYLRSLDSIGERALLLYPPGLEFIAAFFGCLYAGVVAVPAYLPRRNQNGERVRAIAIDAQAKLALTTHSLAEQLQKQLTSDLNFSQLHWLATDQLEGTATQDAQTWTPVSPKVDDLALLQYTSGATGLPKGVMISHAHLLHNAAGIQHCFQDGSESCGVSWLPMYHDMGLIGGVLQPLFVGRPMVLMSPAHFIQKPVRWLQAISRYQATTSGGPNFAYDLCVQKIRDAQKADLDLASWTVAFSGSESIRAKTLEDFAHRFADCGFKKTAFHPCYGMAEATLMVSSKRGQIAPTVCSLDGVALEQHRLRPVDTTAESTRYIVGCGQAALEQHIEIVDPVTLIPCSAQTVGEIWVSGPNIAQGYWERPSESEFAFQAYLANSKQGPFLRTGDLGFKQNGELFITGRLKDVVIIRGRNHYPQDIEWTVESSHPALRAGHSVAFAISVDGIERLVINQEIDRPALRTLDSDRVMQAIRQAVSQEHQLQVYAIALFKPGSLPKTSSGKIQRSACRTAYLSEAMTPVAEWRESSVNVQEIQQSAQAMLAKLTARASISAESAESQPATSLGDQSLTCEAIQNWMVANLALYLNVPPETVDVSEPFSHYGLDSSVALSLTAELSDWISQKLEPTIFWEYPSIKALAHYLGDKP